MRDYNEWIVCFWYDLLFIKLPFYFKFHGIPFRVQQPHMLLQLSSGENDVFHIKYLEEKLISINKIKVLEKERREYPVDDPMPAIIFFDY